MTDEFGKPVKQIDDEALRAFQHEMKKRKVDLDKYKLWFFAKDESFVVETEYKDKAPGIRGSDPDFPDYEVEILKEDFSIKSVVVAR